MEKFRTVLIADGALDIGIEIEFSFAFPFQIRRGWKIFFVGHRPMGSCWPV